MKDQVKSFTQDRYGIFFYNSMGMTMGTIDYRTIVSCGDYKTCVLYLESLGYPTDISEPVAHKYFFTSDQEMMDEIKKIKESI